VPAVHEQELKKLLEEIWQSGGAGREALRESLYRERSWTFPFVRGGENGIMALVAAFDRLYAFQNDGGIIYEFDGDKWTEVFRHPTCIGPYKLAYGQFYSRTFDRLYMGHFTYDGEEWGYISIEPLNNVMSYEEFDGKVYAVLQDRNELYESDDGINFTPVATAPVPLSSLRTFKDLLYVGSGPSTNAPIYAFDGTTLTQVHVAGRRVQYLARLWRVLIAFTAVLAEFNIEVMDKTGTWRDLGVKVGWPFRATYYQGKLIVPGRGDLRYVWAIDGHSDRDILKAIPIYSAVCPCAAEVYDGKLYVSGEYPVCGFDEGAWVAEFAELPKDPVPIKMKLWDGETVPTGGANSPGVPAIGGKAKTIYLLSDQDGTATIQVDINGEGTWRDFDTVSVTADTLMAYQTTHDMTFIRVRFVPSVEATVSAWAVIN